MKDKTLTVLRVAAGAVFIFSGLVKLLQPYQNFLAVIDRFQIISGAPAVWTAHALPWMEYLFGVFLVLGLWSRVATAALWLMSTGLIGVILQALARKLPIEDCGCFGEAFSLPLNRVIFIDLALWAALFAVFTFGGEAPAFSVDRFFSRGRH